MIDNASATVTIAWRLAEGPDMVQLSQHSSESGGRTAGLRPAV
jgi:hypothetical protein